MTKSIEVQKKSNPELSLFVQEQKEALRQGRFASAGSKGRNVKEAREIKKNIARALTLLKVRSEEK